MKRIKTLAGDVYMADDADARIAEAVNRASEMEQRYDHATLRIAELEKALSFYAEARDFYLTDKNGNYVDSANDMARTTLALMVSKSP